MNAADLARLELARRAYRAVEPSAAEVQCGVRKARLALRRPRPRRAWLSKTLIAVVLAMGGLAYAKPQAFRELLPQSLGASAKLTPQRIGGTASPPAAPTIDGALGERHLAAPAPSPMLPVQPAEAAPAVAAKRPVALKAPPSAPTTSPQASDAPASNDSTGAAASRWGRVGQALAQGDEASALAELGELSESADARTRDKADLGRAQLLMARGERGEACAMARSLLNRRAGGRIERQALTLLEGCPR